MESYMSTFILTNETLRLEFDPRTGTLVGVATNDGGWRILDRPGLASHSVCSFPSRTGATTTSLASGSGLPASRPRRTDKTSALPGIAWIPNTVVAWTSS